MKTHSLFKTLYSLAINLISLSLLLSQTLAAEPNAATQAIKKAVLETNAKMAEAEKRLDVDAFFSYIVDSEQCTLIQNGKLFSNRQEAMQVVKKGFQGVATLDRRYENPQVTVLSPEQALLISQGTYSSTLSDGRTFDGRFAVSVVFVLKAGQWKVLHGHYSMPVRP